MAGSIVVVGLSHHSAPVELRERLAVDDQRLPEMLREALDAAELHEGLLISTCNRVEIYGVGRDGNASVRRLRQHLSALAGQRDTDAHLYDHVDHGAVKHAFRVTSSLDSLVVGEPESWAK